MNYILEKIKAMNTDEQYELKELLQDEGIDIDFTGRKFITNKLDTDVNGFTGKRTYKIYAEHEVRYEDSFGYFWKTEWTEIDRLEMSNEDIEREGGNAEWLRQLKEEYNLA